MRIKSTIVTIVFLATSLTHAMEKKLNTASNNNYYFQLNLGYSEGQKPKGDFSGNISGTGIYGGELGYIINDHWRVSLSLDYRMGYRDNYLTTVSTPSNHQRMDFHNIKINSKAAIFNVYYDVININDFIPYVTVGLGGAKNKTNNYTQYLSYTVNSPASILSYNKGTKHNFAWKLGFGNKYKVNEKFDIDMHYQYIDLGSFVTGNTVSLNGREVQSSSLKGKLKAHEFILGLIWKF